MSKYTTDQLKNRYVQGDVVLIRVDALPAGAHKIDGKILQMSEVTGHHHHFVKDAPVTVYALGEKPRRDIRAITLDESKYLVVEQETDLFHGTGFERDPNANKSGDHASQTIAPGVYEVRITHEFDYDRMEASRVVD